MADIHPDKYEEKSQTLHQYGQYLLSCLPKYIQQYDNAAVASNGNILKTLADSPYGRTN
jgi:rRNA-processing protein FCF1